MVAEQISKWVAVIVAILVGVTLVPVVQTTVNNANLTGTSATLMGLVPLFVTIGILLFALRNSL